VEKRNLLAIKALVWIACLAPLGRLAYLATGDGLGANPIEMVTLSTGTWALVFLLAALAITPLRVLTKLHWLIRLRRLIGLFAFFYAGIHFLIYIWIDMAFDLPYMIADIGRRPFIAAGFAAFSLLVPLALTSPSPVMRWMGGRKWQQLHRLVYPCAAAAVTHYWWKVKADIREPFIFAAVLAILLGFRMGHRIYRRAISQPSRAALEQQRGD